MNKTPQYVVDYIRSLSKAEIWKFYKLREWQTVRAEVLRDQHNECQICKSEGRYTPADTVHHVQFVRNHPETALDKYYTHNGKTYVNLIAICKACHNKIHTEKAFNRKHSVIPLTPERW